MTFQEKLIAWFIKNQRPLPWRRYYRPYEVWISEIMLQQTQVKTALPYFHRWMKAFPSIRALAESDEKKVLKLWQGLGYYSRARNLHETACLILKNYGGVFPRKFEDILGLKGIGRYSAGAIASIAFNEPRPIVDGNVLRVLSRVYAIKKPIDVSENKALFWRLEEKLIPKKGARYFNQGLMELGALICTTQNPSCALCPVRTFCAAVKEGAPENYPVRRHRKKIVPITAAALVFNKKGKYYLRRRPVGEIMGGLWEFPEWKLSKNKILALDAVKKKIRALAFANTRQPGAPPVKYLGSLKRNYTNYLETLHVFSVQAANETRKSPFANSSAKPWPAVWIKKKNFKDYPFSSAHARIAAMV
jgi:A/G-specific adenine glycosylase